MMADIFEYLAWRGDLRMKSAVFNPVDSLILCRLSYIPFDGIVASSHTGGSLTIVQAAERFFSPEGEKAAAGKVLFREDTRLLSALAQSGRFGSMRLSGYVNQIDPEEQKQFSAITVHLEDGSVFIAFRGTDNSLIGWREDFNMSYLPTVPSQHDAVAYLESAAQQAGGGLRLGGHSKGGNLAVYAASFCAEILQSRILEVYNNDGPGFDAEVISRGGYQAIKDRIHTFVPQSSVIGMLLEHEEAYTVIHSTQTGIMQHDIYSWEVTRDGFICLDTVSGSSRFIDRTLKEWVAGMDQGQRGKFFDALFEIIGATNAKTTTELTADWLKTARLLLRSLKNVDTPTRKLISHTLGSLLGAAKKSLRRFD